MTVPKSARPFIFGIQSYVKHLNIGKEVVSNNIFYVERRVEDSMVGLLCNIMIASLSLLSRLRITS